VALATSDETVMPIAAAEHSKTSPYVSGEAERMALSSDGIAISVKRCFQLQSRGCK